MNNSPGPSSNANQKNKNDNNKKENIQMSDIELFREICGIDEPSAIALLRESGGDLEAAIHQFFFTRENPEVLQNQNNEVQELRRRAFASTRSGRQDGQTLPLVPAPQGPLVSWAHWLRGIVLIPFRYLYSTAMDIFFFVYNLFFGRPSNRRQITGNTRQNPNAPRGSDVLADRIIMREQQQAYEQALAIDKQKMEQAKMEKRRAQEEADKANNRKAFLSRKKAEVGAKIQTEMAGSAGEDLVRIRVSFPSSARMERNFRHSDSLERLFEVVFVHPDCPDNFSLFTNFPVKQLNCAPDWYWKEICSDALERNAGSIGTFAEAQLFKSANVFVRDNDA